MGTPNAIWTWDCHRCTVQFNEAHHTHSPGVDGGALDIDWDNIDNTVQYNYGHHNDGYCVAVFAAEGSTTSGSSVRYNVCIDNGQALDLAYEGDLFVYAWNGGVIGDVVIHNNTVIRSAAYPPVVVWSPPGAGSGIYNNLFVVDGDWLTTVAGDAPMSNNLWWQSTPAANAWFDDYEDQWYDGIEAWMSTGREAGSLSADPLLNGAPGKDAAQLTAGSPAIDVGAALADPGACDGFGNRLVGLPDIGAFAYDAVVDSACGE